MIEIEPVYTTEAIATGAGRNGHVQSPDGRVSEDLAVPVEMGGSGKGTNPEQLFAAGYAACFHSALQMVARQAKKDLGDSSVGARVSIGQAGEGFGLAVALRSLSRLCRTTRPSGLPIRPTRCVPTRTPLGAISALTSPSSTTDVRCSWGRF